MVLLHPRFLAPLALLLAAGSAQAHPHIFVEDQLEFVFDAKGPEAIRVRWSFDEMYSSSLRSDYTATPSGPLTPADVASLAKSHFGPVAAKHFFTSLTIDGKRADPSTFTDFGAGFVGDKATYTFTLPLAHPTPKGDHELEISTFDPEYYVDFELPDDHPVTVSSPPALGASCVVQVESRETIGGWGRVDVDVVRCTWKGSGS